MSQPIVSGGALDDATAATRHDVDVLVIGGGPAGTWAAISAAARGGEGRARGQGLLRDIGCDGAVRHGDLVCLAAERYARAGETEPF
ncbi:hypothetical protein PQQ87_34065 [Paraburkholderia nemoris]